MESAANTVLRLIDRIDASNMNNVEMRLKGIEKEIGRLVDAIVAVGVSDALQKRLHEGPA